MPHEALRGSERLTLRKRRATAGCFLSTDSAGVESWRESRERESRRLKNSPAHQHPRHVRVVVVEMISKVDSEAHEAPPLCRNEFGDPWTPHAILVSDWWKISFNAFPLAATQHEGNEASCFRTLPNRSDHVGLCTIAAMCDFPILYASESRAAWRRFGLPRAPPHGPPPGAATTPCSRLCR